MKGWYGNRNRHSLASKGVKTAIIDDQYSIVETDNTLPIISEHFEVEQIIYIPSTTELNKKISEDEMNKRIEEVRTKLSDLFGGYTSVSATGGYNDREKGLIVEDVIRVISYATKTAFKENNEKLIKFLEEKRNEWKQGTIGYEVEGDLYYLGEERWSAEGSINKEFKKAWDKQKKRDDEVRKDVAKILSFR